MRLNWMALLLAASACTTTEVVNISQKTALEKQLMGEFEPLSDEALLAASVRAGPGALETAGLAVQQAALKARERQLFNKDDVRQLKSSHCLGEALHAVLTPRPCAQESDSTVSALRARLVGEENADRQTLLAWAQSLSTLSGQAADDIVDAYRRLLLENAQPGDAVQQPDGSWTQR